MNRDERIRSQLTTVVSSAVRLGMTRASYAGDAPFAAEVRDLVELALHVAQPMPGELSADGEKYAAWQKAEGQRKAEFWRNVDASVPVDTLAGKCMAFADADDLHDHTCSKETGHAYGPGASDHQCERCGQLFTLPAKDGAGPTDDVEIEL